MTVEESRAAYPGVERAYDFVLPSYGWMLTRMEAADSRIHATQAFATSFTLAIPAAAKVLNPQLSFTAGRFVLAMVVFVGLTVLGIVARSRAVVRLANPNVLFERWLHYPDWEFKKNAIAWAGEHFEFNAALIQRKARVTLFMTAAFLVELLLLLAWVVTS